jgi:hypothetical protein
VSCFGSSGYKLAVIGGSDRSGVPGFGATKLFVANKLDAFEADNTNGSSVSWRSTASTAIDDRLDLMA